MKMPRLLFRPAAIGEAEVVDSNATKLHRLAEAAKRIRRGRAPPTTPGRYLIPLTRIQRGANDDAGPRYRSRRTAEPIGRPCRQPGVQTDS